jgi:hypothetical protein
MPAVEHVVVRFAAAGEAADAVELAERVETLEAAGQQLVRVGLVAGIPDDAIARRLQETVQRQRELDHPQRRTEVPAGLGHGLNDRFAQLAGELFELGLVEAAEVGRALQVLEDRHGRLAPAHLLSPG